MKFEISKKIDALGRLVIPIDLRNYYGYENREPLVLLSVRNGIQIAKSDLFITEKLCRDSIITIDGLGRIVIPRSFRKKHGFMPYNTLRIVPNETCISIYKEA